MKLLTPRPLTADAYRPYGAVIAADTGAPFRLANQGTAKRFDGLVDLENRRPGAAKLNVSLFRCSPRTGFPFRVEILEHHPKSTQVFVPMSASRYLVAVALGGEEPDLATLDVFLASSKQGISYAPGVWHHPLLALDTETDFACFVHEDGSSDDCRVVRIAIAIAIAAP